ncbi:MAG: hypothetical protein RSC07_01680 [Mucinivorans sp.]
MKLKKGLLTAVFTTLIVLLYGGWSIYTVAHNRAALLCRGVAIEVSDSALCGFVTTEVVRGWLRASRLKIEGEPLDNVDLFAIENCITSQNYVSHTDVFATMDGVVHLRVEQHHPVLRLMGGGYDFYLDSALNLLPSQLYYTMEVPMVIGDFRFNFANTYFGVVGEKKYEKDSVFLKKLCNFVEYINKDDFLRSLQSQIYVTPERKIEIVPRIGVGIISVGDLSDIEDKMLRLKTFYTSGSAERWLSVAKNISVEYKNQVIVK